MEIREEVIETLVIIEPVGQLDTRTSPALEERVSRHLNEKRHSFVVDFGSIEYISSAGLRVLLMLAKKLKSSEGRLVLCGMNAHVREVFDIAGFTKIFEIVTTRDEATVLFGEPEEQEDRADPEVERVAMLASRLMDGESFKPARTDEVPMEVIQIADKAAELLGISAHRKKTKKPRQAPPPPPPVEAATPVAEQLRGDEQEPTLWQKILRMLGLDRG